MPPDIPSIGPSVYKQRKARKLTLEQLAELSGVSRSMLSQIERGEANPTFAVLWNLTGALGIALSDLIESNDTAESKADIEIVAAPHLPEIGSADGLCRLRILSPPDLAGHVEWYEVHIEPGGRLESWPHAKGAREHFSAWTKGLHVSSGAETAILQAGETARYRADVHHTIANRSKRPARGLLVVIYQ